MNYQAQNTTHALAAEYVLGTLRGGARRRFRQLLLEHKSIQTAVVQWESYFNDLALRLEPVAPDPLIWEKIQSRIDDTDIDDLAIDNVVSLPVERSNLWRGVSALASAAVIVLAVLLLMPSTTQTVSPQQLTVVQNEQAEPLWLVEILPNRIAAQATQSVPQFSNYDYELWMVPEDGSAPVSLGLLPQSGKVEIPKHALFEQIDIAALAVSKEALGGSATGAPTDVLFIAKLAIL